MLALFRLDHRVPIPHVRIVRLGAPPNEPTEGGLAPPVRPRPEGFKPWTEHLLTHGDRHLFESARTEFLERVVLGHGGSIRGLSRRDDSIRDRSSRSHQCTEQGHCFTAGCSPRLLEQER